MAELFFSTDIEADGPIPGPNSMLSFGCAAFDQAGNQLDTFSRNLELMDGATQHPDTMLWWAGNQAAYNATRVNCIRPSQAMLEFFGWVFELCEQHGNARAVFVGYPVTYDFMWVYWYLMRYCGKSPFSHSGLDIKTLGMVLLRCGYRQVGKRNLSKLFPLPEGVVHTHVAIDDAIEQGIQFSAMLKAARALR